MKKTLAGILIVGLLAVILPVAGLLLWKGRHDRKTESQDTAAAAPSDVSSSGFSASVTFGSPATAAAPSNALPRLEPLRRSTGDRNLVFDIQGRERVNVTQTAETDVELSVIRHSEYTLASASLGVGGPPSMSLVLAGQFQGEVKLAAEIAKGGKGLTVKFDPETVKGSDDSAKLKINADADADLGDVDVKLTATTPEGRTISMPITVAVYKK